MSTLSKNKRLAELEAMIEADPLVQADFPLVAGERLSSLHAYSVYSALKTLEPRLEENPTVLINSIAGARLYNKQIETHCNSKLQMRVPISFAGCLYALAGKRLSVGQGSICLQAPTITPLQPKRNLYCRIVTIKPRGLKGTELTAQEFLMLAQRQLTTKGIRGNLSLVSKQGEPIRRVIRIKGQFITGYAVEVKELNETDSLKLQQLGLGGRNKMGGGWFE
jgi:CRISPR-associated endonuclease/helicase Cas3